MPNDEEHLFHFSWKMQGEEEFLAKSEVEAREMFYEKWESIRDKFSSSDIMLSTTDITRWEREQAKLLKICVKCGNRPQWESYDLCKECWDEVNKKITTMQDE